MAPMAVIAMDQYDTTAASSANTTPMSNVVNALNSVVAAVATKNTDDPDSTSRKYAPATRQNVILRTRRMFSHDHTSATADAANSNKGTSSKSSGPWMHRKMSTTATV